MSLLKWAAIFLVLAAIAALFGFTGIERFRRYREDAVLPVPGRVRGHRRAGRDGVPPSRLSRGRIGRKPRARSSQETTK